MKNLILGVAKGYDWYTLEPFINSYAKNCSDAELVLFVDKISDFHRYKMIQAGATLENFPEELKGIPNNTRWKLFLDYLEAHGDDYEQIFITDTRDVIFQADLFAPYKHLSNWLGCVTEADDIGGSKTGDNVNYRWIVSCFGKDMAEKLREKKIICCGTVIGSSHEMKIFCRELWKILAYKTDDIFDQAVTNCLVYNGLMPIKNIFELDSDISAILTVALFVVKNPVGIYNNVLLRSDYSVPAVVHQYERNNKFSALVDEIYRDKNFSFNERFNDPRSSLEQICCLLHVDKLVEATRYFLKFFFVTVDFTEHVHSILNVWNIALQKKFSPTVETIELAAQNALLTVDFQKFSATQLISVQDAFIRAQKENHAVYPEFKAHFVNWMNVVAERAKEMNSQKF